MVQLEYWLDGDWREVVRYDHDIAAPGGHDITEEGLHLDIYKDGKKVDARIVSPPIPANEGFNAAEDDLLHNAQRYIRRFEQWHEVRQRSDL